MRSWNTVRLTDAAAPRLLLLSRAVACVARDVRVGALGAGCGYCTARAAVMSSNDNMVDSSGVRVAHEVYSATVVDWIARSIVWA